MWDGITTVYDREYDPIIYEGRSASKLVVVNVGPGRVKIHAWKNIPSESNTSSDICLEMRMGDIRSLQGVLVRAEIVYTPGGKEFAALGWRVLGE